MEEEPQPGMQRRLAAILSADAVGYSRLMGDDEVATVQTLSMCRALIAETVAASGGRVVDAPGDNILAEFGSAVDAVQAASVIQTRLGVVNADLPVHRRMEFRIGINLGDVLVEEGRIYGDGVNVAARLEAQAGPGGVVISASIYEQVHGKVELDFVDRGKLDLKNIPEPVHAYALKTDQPTSPVRAAVILRSRRSRLAPLGAGMIAIVLVAAGLWYFLVGNRSAPVEAAHLSIVVLPFANLSNDPSQDYFADGITENLTIDLSRIRNSFVIARDTAYTYKGKTVDAREIGKTLGVRYVLEGSVQRDKNRVRVNAQLIDADSGANLWADRFEENISDLFKLEDQVVARLANALRHELVMAEAEKGARSQNPDAIDLTLRGLAAARQVPPTKDDALAARAWFDQALKIDPDDALALAGEAYTYMLEYEYGWADADTDYDAKIIGPADRAIALAPDTMTAYLAKGAYLTLSRRANDALGADNAGLAINPNFAPLYAARGGAEISLGHFDQAKSDIEQAMKISPLDPLNGFRHMQLGDVELGLRQFDAAIVEYHLAIDAGFRTYTPYVDMAAAQALGGKLEDAKAALAEARRLNPSLTVKWLTAHSMNIPPLFEGVRKAGLAEGGAPAAAPSEPAVAPSPTERAAVAAPAQPAVVPPPPEPAVTSAPARVQSR